MSASCEAPVWMLERRPRKAQRAATSSIASSRAHGILEIYGTSCCTPCVLEHRRRIAGSGTIHLRRVPLVLRHGPAGISGRGQYVLARRVRRVPPRVLAIVRGLETKLGTLRTANRLEHRFQAALGSRGASDLYRRAAGCDSDS